MSGQNGHHPMIETTSPKSIGSSPHDDTVVGSSSSRYGKRASCDGCRGQKLRCLGDDQSGDSSCERRNRYIRAGGICNFGTWKPAGRNLTSDVTPPTSVQDIRAQLTEE